MCHTHPHALHRQAGDDGAKRLGAALAAWAEEIPVASAELPACTGASVDQPTEAKASPAVGELAPEPIVPPCALVSLPLVMVIASLGQVGVLALGNSNADRNSHRDGERGDECGGMPEVLDRLSLGVSAPVPAVAVFVPRGSSSITSNDGKKQAAPVAVLQGGLAARACT